MTHFYFLRSIMLLAAVATITLFGCTNSQAEKTQPNVIIILTDDQGYEDIGLHGNEIVNTPNIDQLGRESTRFTQFFVSPLCQPTRASLLTGRNKVIGRRIEPNEQTLPQLFKHGGYRTAIFGKWHLGEYYPFRPIDKGFDEQLLIGGGAIGQVQDYWGNTNFDPYLNDGDNWKKYEGYSTDILFDQAMSWMDQKSTADEPFFCYLSTNAAHSPFQAPDAYKRPYLAKGLKDRQASFYGMITNLDDNLGRLRAFLKEKGIADNTILVFLTDNGTTMGGIHSNKLRGFKTSIYEGGSRAAAFFHWPTGFKSGDETKQLAMHYDLLPTFSELLNIPLVQGEEWASIEGKSLAPLLKGKKVDYGFRTHIVYQGFWPPNEPLRQYENTSIRSQNYRLANGNELYDLENDIGEQINIMAENKPVANELKQVYDQWWDKTSENLEELRVYKAYPVGQDIGKAITMSALHYYDSKVYPEAQKWFETKFYLQSGLEKLLLDESSQNPELVPLLGQWKINFESPGKYQFVLKKGTFSTPPYLKMINPGTAKLKVNKDLTTSIIEETAESVTIELVIEKSGTQMIECWFDGQRGDGKPSGAYFVDIIRQE
ncbi:MAG: arylsulfatase [Bacteroidota bacterium]